MKKKLIYLIIFMFCTAGVFAQITFSLKSAPAYLDVYLNGELINPVSFSYPDGVRKYTISQKGILTFKAMGYKTLEYHYDSLPANKNIVSIKLENETGRLQLISEHKTGVQPKSAYFTADGKRLFVPLLDDRGIEVFKITDTFLEYEKRLTVPNSRAVGFVEALCDERRRELWVSNMFQDRLHIYNLDTLEYKTSVPSGGVLSKLIVQSPDGNITVVSNWLSLNISVFNSDTKELLARIPIRGTPRGMAFSPDGNTLYVCNYDFPEVVVIDMTKNAVTTRWRYRSGEGAARHIIYNDGKLYVSDMHPGSINILDPITGVLIRSTLVAPCINTIVLSPDGKYIFASSRGNNHPVDYTIPGPDFGAVYMLRADNLVILERIWGRNQPTGLAVSPDGKFLAFTDFLDANLEWYSLNY